jgi:hypothetical protein
MRMKEERVQNHEIQKNGRSNIKTIHLLGPLGGVIKVLLGLFWVLFDFISPGQMAL